MRRDLFFQIFVESVWEENQAYCYSIMNHLQQRNSLNSAFLSTPNDILIETTNNIVNTYDPNNETNTFIFNDYI